MLRTLAAAALLLLAPLPALAAPILAAFDHDRALGEAGYRSLGSLLLPLADGAARSYAVSFAWLPSGAGMGGGIFSQGGPLLLPDIPPGQAIGLRLIAATEGEATNRIDAVPAATTLSGAVDPLAVGLLLPAVQSVREPPPAGDGPTCEPPPEPICQEPAGAAPFEPVEWLVLDFGEPLLSFRLEGAYDFRPAASASLGPNAMALELHYLRRAAIAEPGLAGLLGAGGLAALALRRRRPPQPS